MVAKRLQLESFCFHYLQKEILFEVFPDAVIIRATRALFWPEIPTVFFWEDKHLVQTPLEEGAQLLQQFDKSLTMHIEVCWSSKKD